MHIKFTKETLDLINLCEKVTEAKIKDLYNNDVLTIIVEKGNASKAIGKNGIKIKKLSSLLKKRIKIVEFNDQPEIFTENFIMPLKGKVYKNDSTVFIEINDIKSKGILIGRNQKNINHLKDLLLRYFKLNVKVV